MGYFGRSCIFSDILYTRYIILFIHSAFIVTPARKWEVPAKERCMMTSTLDFRRSSFFSARNFVSSFSPTSFALLLFPKSPGISSRLVFVHRGFSFNSYFYPRFFQLSSSLRLVPSNHPFLRLRLASPHPSLLTRQF